MIQQFPGRSLIVAIDTVNPIARIRIAIASHTSSHIRHFNWPRTVNKVIKHFKVVKVSMAKKLSRNSRLISVHYSIIISALRLETTHGIHVANYVDLFSNQLTLL